MKRILLSLTVAALLAGCANDDLNRSGIISATGSITGINPSLNSDINRDLDDRGTKLNGLGGPAGAPYVASEYAALEIPALQLPAFEIPALELPALNLPAQQLPARELPAVYTGGTPR